MSVRPPRPRRPARRAIRYRDIPIVSAISGALVAFGLRVVMALTEVPTWTAGWRLVDTMTLPLVRPLRELAVLRHTPLGNLALADLLAALIVVVASLLALASLSIRRAPR